MKPSELQRMYELEGTYWWFVGRRSVIDAWLSPLAAGLPEDPEILDIGCGTGGNARILQALGQVTGSDPAPTALEFCRERGLDQLIECGAEDLCVPDESMDLVTSFEVFEHVDEDSVAAAEAYRVLRPGGRLVMTVPAYQWLWSDHDVALGHKRRYSRRALRALLEEAGFEVERLSHCVTILLPLTVLFRWAQRLLRPVRRERASEPESGLVVLPRPVSALFVWSLRIEAALLRRISLPWGVTLIAQAIKKSN